MTRNVLKKYFYRIVNTDMKSNGYSFSPAAEMSLREFISSGVIRMTDNECSDREKLKIAENNIRSFAEFLRHEQHGKIINNRTLTLIRLSKCPMWPFC